MSRFGSDRLSRDLSQSIIGAVRFHCRVRDGIECITHAITTKSTQDLGTIKKMSFFPYVILAKAGIQRDCNKNSLQGSFFKILPIVWSLRSDFIMGVELIQ